MTRPMMKSPERTGNAIFKTWYIILVSSSSAGDVSSSLKVDAWVLWLITFGWLQSSDLKNQVNFQNIGGTDDNALP